MREGALILEDLAPRKKSRKAEASIAKKSLENENAKNNQHKRAQDHLQIACAGNTADVQSADDHNNRNGDRDDGQRGDENGQRDSETHSRQSGIEGAREAVQRTNEKHQPALTEGFANVSHRSACDREGGGEFTIVESDAEGEQTTEG